MKRTVQVIVTAAALAAAAPAPSLNLNTTVGFSAELCEAVEASRAHSKPASVLRVADFVRKFDRGIVEAFSKAWRRSMNGSSPLEGVVLILRMADGSYSGRDMGSTNEFKRFTFRWHPATVAVVHTHPNSTDPAPHGLDRALADNRRVPIFTITSRGMYVYDPGTKKFSRVLDGLDWLDASKFSKAMFAKQ